MTLNAFGLGMDDAAIAAFPPDRAVYTLRLVGGESGCNDGEPCDMAWDTPEGTREHFWRKAKWFDAEFWGTPEVVEMTAREFLERRWRGMNPFWDINRAEFMGRWRAHHRLHEPA